MSNKIGRILVAKKIITESHLIEALNRKEKEPNKYLGQIICEMGLPQPKIIKAIYYSNKRKKLGEILIDLKIITPDKLQNILLQQTDLKHKKVYMPLGTLLAKNGIISEDQYMEALSAHFCMSIVSLKDFKVSPSLQRAIGEPYALKNNIVVMDDSPLKVTVVVAEPHLLALETIEKSMPEGKYVVFCIAKASEIEACLDAQYGTFSKSGYGQMR
jgi:hypothetical protein